MLEKYSYTTSRDLTRKVKLEEPLCLSRFLFPIEVTAVPTVLEAQKWKSNLFSHRDFFSVDQIFFGHYHLCYKFLVALSATASVRNIF